jgi:hypothetical protein
VHGKRWQCWNRSGPFGEIPLKTHPSNHGFTKRMRVKFCKASGCPLIIPAYPPHATEKGGNDNSECGKRQHRKRWGYFKCLRGGQSNSPRARVIVRIGSICAGVRGPRIVD